MKGELKKLRIEAYKDIEYNKKVDTFEVMFNPSTYSRSYQVEYESGQGQGTTGSNQKFKKIKPQDFQFEFILDGTGASGTKIDVPRKIDKFLDLTTRMDGDIHRPYYLKIICGGLVSRCVLKQVEFTYTLFNTDGEPLRAKVNATFSGIKDDNLRIAEEDKNSPDLTRQRTVGEGDTLPLMTYEVYGDSSYYLDVARHNNLRNFRTLNSGMTIEFPPLRQQTS